MKQWLPVIASQGQWFIQSVRQDARTSRAQGILNDVGEPCFMGSRKDIKKRFS
jgi:hypothetical protein